MNKLEISSAAELEATEKSFNSILVLDGEGKIGNLTLKKGNTCFIPAGYGKYTFEGKAEVILTDVL